jgi:hypothetical protein
VAIVASTPTGECIMTGSTDAPGRVGSEAQGPSSAASRDAQAIVVVHGIGAQRPLSTLRGFARAIRDPQRPMFAVPDRTDTSYELHTLVLPADDGHRRTDLYEGYWAPESTGTRLAHVARWGRRLLLRPPWHLPRRIRAVAIRVLVALGIAVAAVVWLGSDIADLLADDDVAWLAAAGKALLALLAAAAVHWLTDSLGDAARYLDVHPRNVAQRQAIRARLVGLLDELHECGRYDRIVVVGHSLGGVIAYDAVRLLWRERLQGVALDERFDDTELSRAIAELQTAMDLLDPDQRLHPAEDPAIRAAQANYRRAQERLFAAFGRQDPGRWLISDLITLGSPVAHAGWLLADGSDDLRTRIVERELPTCPPQPTEPGRAGLSYADTGGRRLHHGAVFGLTRWTNGWFPGDPVGGPVLDTGATDRTLSREAGLGIGVVDLRLPGTRGVLRGLASHTRYWTEERARLALIDALALDPVRIVDVTRHRGRHYV